MFTLLRVPRRRLISVFPFDWFTAMCVRIYSVNTRMQKTGETKNSIIYLITPKSSCKHESESRLCGALFSYVKRFYGPVESELSICIGPFFIGRRRSFCLSCGDLFVLFFSTGVFGHARRTTNQTCLITCNVLLSQLGVDYLIVCVCPPVHHRSEIEKKEKTRNEIVLTSGSFDNGLPKAKERPTRKIWTLVDIL